MLDAAYIDKLQTRLNAVEAEREHWLLDSQLLRLKYHKEAQVLALSAESNSCS